MQVKQLDPQGVQVVPNKKKPVLQVTQVTPLLQV